MHGLSLADTQAALNTYLLDGRNDQTAVIALIDHGYGLPREQRLNIYHRAYRSRLQEIMGTIYERTWAYLGDDEFAEEAGAYIEAHPSKSRNLRDYGAGFPDFLANTQTGNPEVGELARMDWLLHNAFDAPDVLPLSPGDIAQLGEEDWAVAGFAFHPSLSTAVFTCNTVEIWHALDQGLTPPAARALEAPVSFLFWRQGHQSQFRSLHPLEHFILGELLAGQSFAAACEAASDAFSDAETLIGGYFRQWLAEEILCRLTGLPPA